MIVNRVFIIETIVKIKFSKTSLKKTNNWKMRIFEIAVRHQIQYLIPQKRIMKT